MPQLVSSLYVSKLPFLRDYDFNGALYSPGETILLSPENPREYECLSFYNGELSIFPLVKYFFNTRGEFSVSELDRKIRENEKLNKFLSFDKNKPFQIHHAFLQKYEEEGIAWCKRDVDRKRPIFFDSDIFRPGALYDKIRVKTQR